MNKAQSELRESIGEQVSKAIAIVATDGSKSGVALMEILKIINKREALLKKKFEDEVIGEDQPIPAMDRSVAYNWKRIEAVDRNVLRAEQRKKLKEI